MKIIKKLLFFFLAILLSACNLTNNTEYKKGYQDGFKDGLNAKTENKLSTNDNSITNNNTNPTENKNNQQYTPKNDPNYSNVPKKVIDVLHYIRNNNKAMDGYVGGRTFKNYEKQLPERDASGTAIQYQEWDVNPKIEGKNRGTERLVTSKDKAYFTNNHYKSFVEVTE